MINLLEHISAIHIKRNLEQTFLPILSLNQLQQKLPNREESPQQKDLRKGLSPVGFKTLRGTYYGIFMKCKQNLTYEKQDKNLPGFVLSTEASKTLGGDEERRGSCYLVLVIFFKASPHLSFNLRLSSPPQTFTTQTTALICMHLLFIPKQV